ncbi:universal stress protein [Cupriavidus alkaliphilus]|uniref:Nucleotide-binding universal stress UspA family protein n=2 Tax=Cupriavidus TaxID=106589 RepID=A0A7W4VED1_9BURK|nr:universal stress protein [Cupriavidus alkaliphilus]MBB3010068.1 nucleotide-binding universal stress UspA family protein [Cupriavidus alkaliphilus]PVY80478.1 universal stress protein family protein [Cupriavidus alkaliphilus]
MACDSILVHLDSGRQATQRLALAGRLAVTHGCPLIGFYAGFVPEPAWCYRMENAQRYFEEDMARREAAREAVRGHFLARTDGLPVVAEWRVPERVSVASALREAREAGLLVAAQFDADNSYGVDGRQLLAALLLESGRPTLVVPSSGVFQTLGTRVVVAWNGSREAARALHDAAPFMVGARAHVLCAHTPAEYVRPDATPVEHAARVLERHGVSVEIEHGPGGADMTVGELILSRASDFGADLVVMGAYGHGRMRERVLGGVTRTLLESMTVPVMFSR